MTPGNDATDPTDRSTAQQLDLANALLAASRQERDRFQQERDRFQQERDHWHRQAQLAAEQADRMTRQVQEIYAHRAHRALTRLDRLLAALRDRQRRGAVESQSESDVPLCPPEAPPSPPRAAVLVDDSALVESTRSGIARVTIQLARALAALAAGGVAAVAPGPAGLAADRRFATQLALEPPTLPSPDEQPPPTALVSATVHPQPDLDSWLAAVDRHRASGGVYLQIVHDLLPIVTPDFFDDGGRRHFPVWLAAVLARADAVLTDSEATRTDLERWLGTHPLDRPDPPMISTIRLGALTLPPADGDGHRPVAAAPTVLTVGTIEPRKGIENLLDSAELVWRSRPEVRFVVFGGRGWIGQETLDRLNALARSAHPLTWVANGDDAALADAYRSADLLVAPSRAEGFGLPIVEALAFGVPVLARDIPVFRELVTDDASFFATDEELAPAILRRLADPTPSHGSHDEWDWTRTARQVLAAAAALPVGRT